MVAELAEAEFWLPAEFFNEDFNTENNPSLTNQHSLNPIEVERFSTYSSYKHPAAAAWEVMRMRQMEQKFNGFSRFKKPFCTSEFPFTSFPSPTYQQLQVYQLQIYQLKRQQLINRQLAAAWFLQRRTVMAYPPISTQHLRTELKGNRRPSAGTGVFLPKMGEEVLKKPASFSVLPGRDLHGVDYELGGQKWHQQQHIPAAASPPAVTSLDVLLPTEWMY